MATRWIHSGLAVPDGVGGKAGFAVSETGALGINRGPDFKGNLTSDPGTELIPVQRVLTVSANTTLTDVCNGALIIFSSATTRTVTLPPATTKARFTFYNASGSTVHNISPVSTDGIGGSSGAATDALLTSVDDKDLIMSAYTGNTVTIQADGVADWYIVAASGTLTKES